MTPKKQQLLQKLSNEQGIIAALALDQRGSLRKMLTSAAGVPMSAEKIAEFKQYIVEELTPYASAILLDPEYGLNPAKKRDKNCGLLLAYEKTGYDTTRPGKMPDLLPDWSAYRLQEEGTDAVKFMLYYDADEDVQINGQKQAFVERIGAECKAVDLPFFLELMSYDIKIDDAKSEEYAKVKPHKVNKMVEEFAKERYAVDVLKVEVPVNMSYVKGFNQEGAALYSKEEAQQAFRDQDKAAGNTPFIFLSAGVSADLFRETLQFAHEAGSTFNGVLCGRATWRGSIEPFAKEGEAAARQWLNTVGKENIEDLNRVLRTTAAPWQNKLK